MSGIRRGEKGEGEDMKGKSPLADSPPVRGVLEEFGPMLEIDGYRFLEKDSKKNIQFDIDEASMVDGSSLPQIKTATLEKLVERITHESRPNNELLHIFLMTYPTFTTSEELLSLLDMRFYMPTPVDSSKLERFTEKVLQPVRLRYTLSCISELQPLIMVTPNRVFVVLKLWLEKFFTDCIVEPTLVESVVKFIDNVLIAEGTATAQGRHSSHEYLSLQEWTRRDRHYMAYWELQERNTRRMATLMTPPSAYSFNPLPSRLYLFFHTISKVMFSIPWRTPWAA